MDTIKSNIINPENKVVPQPAAVEVSSIRQEVTKPVIEDESNRVGLGKEIEALKAADSKLIIDNTKNVDEKGYIKVEKVAGVLPNSFQEYANEFIKRISK